MLYKSYILLKAFWETSGKSKKAKVRTEPEDEARTAIVLLSAKGQRPTGLNRWGVT